jgi:hypothetical protein
MSETLSVLIVDNETGDVVERDFTQEEVDAHNDYLTSENLASTNKAEARESALAKLAALGLTQEEIEALV